MKEVENYPHFTDETEAPRVAESDFEQSGMPLGADCSVNVGSRHQGTASQPYRVSPCHWAREGGLSCCRKRTSCRPGNSLGHQKAEFHGLVRSECSLMTGSCNPVTKATKMGTWGGGGLYHTSLCAHEPLPAVPLALPFPHPSVHAQGATR